ncbi:MAG TPA: acetyl-CoA carboxylase biotin carboxyl carrier protein [Pyrinomonadaceae bacterium]|nr:acetyl-CoA carboxylase biotin carboxyl carrier protein [Pyrinomonadaceae bacterium]
MSDQDQQTQPPAHEHTHRDAPRGGERDHGGARRGGRGRRRPHQPSQGGQPQTSARGREESLLNLSELRELADLFSSHGLTDFEFENADIRIRLSRNAAPAPAPAYQPLTAAPAQPTPAPQETAPTTAEASPATGAAPAEEPAADLHIITSPIVGTFYRSPSPTADAFVRAGSQVEPDTVVCIIEAMKLMNEILAETTGTVEKIYVENGQPVEYGQPLFGIKK